MGCCPMTQSVTQFHVFPILVFEFLFSLLLFSLQGLQGPENSHVAFCHTSFWSV